MKELIVLGISILSFALFAADRQTYRDAQGRTAGTASTSGNRTTYRDAQGRTAGTATTLCRSLELHDVSSASNPFSVFPRFRF